MSSSVVPLPTPPDRGRSSPSFIELVTTSNFSFLRGASHPEEFVSAAISMGFGGLGLCDRNSLAGVVRAYREFIDSERPAGAFRYLVGTRLCFADGTPDIVVYPSDRDAYGRLCKLLSVGNSNGQKGAARLTLADLWPYADGQLFILMPSMTKWDDTERVLADLVAHAPQRVWVAGSCIFKGDDRARLNRFADLGRRHGAPMLATNDVLYHHPDRRIVQDVVTCIREHTTIFAAGRQLEQNAERHLKPPSEMGRLFAEHPEALAETLAFAKRVTFSLEDLRYNYPDETVGLHETAQETLERLTWKGAKQRYPAGIPDEIKSIVWAELCLIAYKRYAAYFLTVHDIIDYARNIRRILCQGRGSAANSAVCFCLGITEVDPTKARLVFGRFLSTERNEPPDIDVDFEHERREEVMQYVYAKYGGNHTGLTANVITYRGKSSLREVGKVFGLSDDAIAALNQMHWGGAVAFKRENLKEIDLHADEPTLARVLECAKALRGFPRHLSQHVGGFVITRDHLDHLVPISKTAMESRTIIEWNKDDIDTLGILKVDVLALGMLTCLRRSFELMYVHYGKDIKLAELLIEEHDHPERAVGVYDMTHRADTIGVFQIESRAQMSMLPRLKPKVFYDLVIEVAIVRPGPIQGGMVHPYLKRRQGLEKAEPLGPDLEAVLQRTLGVPLFQEQAMQIAVVGAGFTPGEADGLRRAMATWRQNGKIELFRERFVTGMIGNGYAKDLAERCFKQIEGFGDYGFPESHAASFALLVYASCWLKCHYPDVFACSLLNSQPMGFYAPAQIVRDAIEHGVEVRPVDINHSDYLHVLEDGTPARDKVWERHAEMRDEIWSTKAIRLGLSQIVGLKQDHANLIVARRGRGYDSVRDLWLRTRLAPSILQKLAEADAFTSLGLNRRDALWAIKGLMGTDGAELLPLFSSAGLPAHRAEPDADLPPMPPGESVVYDYRTLTLSLKAHPVSFLRDMLDRRRILPSHALSSRRNGEIVEVAGLVLVRQRPGTASGIIFATLEDETGIANIVIFNKVFEANRRAVLGSRMLSVRGQLQIEGLVVHIIAREFTDMTPHLMQLASGRDLGNAVLSRADEGRTDVQPGRDAAMLRQQEAVERAARAALPKGRNFH
ncbi:MAG: DNA polymerase III subunit alpha [Hyphomicrobiales bacterium]|nr:MAG: DNA polymerase III subunit alpha [Hyphomicrobiales bacterium]